MQACTMLKVGQCPLKRKVNAALASMPDVSVLDNSDLHKLMDTQK